MEISDKGLRVGQVSRVSNIPSVLPPEMEEAEKTGSAADTVEVSDAAVRKAQLHKAAEILMQTPDVDRDKVAALKKQIADGTYQADFAKVAERMLSEDLLLSNP